ncbi:hypothetical protein QQY66_14360 [Streptomyces sp. DG2A-72]|uniref:hypothetical protein n=1 Tax=Streptomyces sp. DG2A-72 TaxID=3051386 RepID=UPI00265C697C|nr:hypothetical protein [Streptomyces sp. DG2A-72]MDO0932820.1 hypothetical protein [Streptomyces sp. DG2A-72]
MDTDRTHGDRDIPRTTPAPTTTTTPGGTSAGLVLVAVVVVATVAVLVAATRAVLVIASGAMRRVAIITVGLTLTGAWSLVRPGGRLVGPPGSPGSVIAPRSPVRPLRSAVRPARSLVRPRVRRSCAE